MVENNPIFQRRSVQWLQTKAVEDEKVELLLRAAMKASRAKNQQLWEFCVAINPAATEQLGKVTPYSASVGRVPLAVFARTCAACRFCGMRPSTTALRSC